jgi:SNF2 family DNA or RNA helicase
MNDGAEPFSRGMYVRLIDDVQRTGVFQDVTVRSGTRFGRIQTLTGIVYWELEDIEPVPTALEEPLEFLRGARLSEPARLRQVLAHIRLTGRLADVFYSMEATNTQFHAHQFKPVLKMLSSPTGNLLIADEVGLGKTIEAGLIWTELRARFDYRRLLVVCPKVLCAKWEAELINKFGLDARILSPSELLTVLSDREKWTRGFVAVCSLQALKPPRGWDESEPQRQDRAAARLARLLQERGEEDPLFDLLVIDEAHHLRNPDTQSNQLARILRQTTQHQVFLSATPIHLRNADLFSLLSLIDNETFRHDSVLREIIEANRPIVEAREAALSGKNLAQIRASIEAAAQHPLLTGSQKIEALLNGFARSSDPLPRAERARLADELDQVNLLANTVTRTRRRDVQELRIVRDVKVFRANMAQIEREAYDAISHVVYSYARKKDMPAKFLLASPQRLLASCIPAAIAHWTSQSMDLESEDGEFQEDDRQSSKFPLQNQDRPLVNQLAAACSRLQSPRVFEQNDSKFAIFIEALSDFLNSNPGEKAIIFSTFRHTLRYLDRRLGRAGIKCEIIHGEIPDRNAALTRFERDPSIRVLLSSEVGSEGIDLQFCRTVFNYDLPWNPMRVEQRIGRVDRLGQAADSVTIVNLLHRDTIDDEIYSRLFERLRLCEQALGGFEDVLGEEIQRLTPELLSGQLTEDQRARRIDQTSQAIENRLKIEKQLEEEAAALIAHGDRVTMSIRAAHALNRWIGTQDLARYLADGLASLFPGSAIRDIGREELYELRLSQQARAAYAAWLQEQRHPNGRLEQETGVVLCRLGRPSGSRHGRRDGIETLTQTHPFVRFLSQGVSETEAPKLRPAVAARVRLSDIKSERPLRPGRYAIMAMLWRFSGLVDQERIAYSGLALPDGGSLEDDDAERLLLAAAESGTLWSEASTSLDCATIADFCQKLVLERLTDRFFQERATRRADADDRAAIQVRTLEQRVADERRKLLDIIERNRMKISQGSGDERRAGSVIAMTEGRLRKLEERAALRRAAIERSRSQTAQDEQLAVVIIEVIT